MNTTTFKSNDSPLVVTSGPTNVLSTVRSVASKVTDTVREWNRRSRQRKHLGTLDDRFLRDMGISGEQARAEFSKPVWRP